MSATVIGDSFIAVIGAALALVQRHISEAATAAIKASAQEPRRTGKSIPFASAHERHADCSDEK